jgi:hypothetical protein
VAFNSALFKRISYIEKYGKMISKLRAGKNVKRRVETCVEKLFWNISGGV